MIYHHFIFCSDIYYIFLYNIIFICSSLLIFNCTGNDSFKKGNKTPNGGNKGHGVTRTVEFEHCKIKHQTIDKKGCKVTKNEYTEVKHVDTLKGHDKKKKKVNEGGKVLPNHFNAIELAALTDGKKDHDNMGNKNKQTIRKGIRNGQSELVKLSPKTKDLPKQKESDCNTDASTNNIHDTVDGSGNPKYINLVKLGLDKSLSDKETKNNNSGKKDLRKKDLSNKQNKFSDTDTKRIRNLIKTATYESKGDD